MFKVGDKVRVVEKIEYGVCAHEFKVGDVVEINIVFSDGAGVSLRKGSYGCLARFDQIELIKESKNV